MKKKKKKKKIIIVVDFKEKDPSRIKEFGMKKKS